MQEPPDHVSASGNTIRTRDEEHHGVVSSQGERRTEVGLVRTQRGALEDIPEDVRRRGHEPTDVRARSIFYAILGLIVAIAVSGAFVGGVLFTMRDRDEQAREGSVARVPARVSLYPPEPRLQISPQEDRRAFEAAARAQLDGYGWTEERGRAHIPIGRAMELLVAHGWPDLDEPNASAGNEISAGSPPPPAPEPRTMRQPTPREPSNPGASSLEAPP